MCTEQNNRKSQIHQRRPDACVEQLFAMPPFIYIRPQGAPPRDVPPYHQRIRNINILGLQTVSEFAINTFQMKYRLMTASVGGNFRAGNQHITPL